MRSAKCEMRIEQRGFPKRRVRKVGLTARLCGLSTCNKDREKLSSLIEERGATDRGGNSGFEQELQPVFRFRGFFFADGYFVNEVVARLCANGFTVVRTD